LEALQLPPPRPPGTWYVPDIEVPDTVPVYETPPTAPNVMALPVRFPVMLSVVGGDESTIWPLTADPVCCQVRVNVPLKTPLYWPVHPPETLAAAAAAAVVGAGALVAGADVMLLLAAAVGVGVSEVDEPQAANNAPLSSAVTPIVIRIMSSAPPLSM
jgi:hypothetical protein